MANPFPWQGQGSSDGLGVGLEVAQFLGLPLQGTGVEEGAGVGVGQTAGTPFLTKTV